MDGKMNFLLSFIPLIAILLYIPAVCISDWRTRTFPAQWFIPLIAGCIPTTIAYLLESPERNYLLMELSLGLCLILFIMAYLKAIGGADFIFASIIIISMQFNPLKFPRVFFALDFFWTLVLVQILVVAGVLIYNMMNRMVPENTSFSRLMWSMANTWPGKFPHAPNMLIISVAFLSTLIMEMVI